MTGAEDNRGYVRIALKQLHDSLLEKGDPLSLLKADLALLMALSDYYAVNIDCEGLHASIDHDGEEAREALDSLRSHLTYHLAARRRELGENASDLPIPW